jgi:hypothetical protein
MPRVAPSMRAIERCGRMLWRENELGWRLHKTWYGFVIKQPHVPLRSHLGRLGPVALNLLLVGVV